MYTFLMRRYRRLRAENERGSALILVIGIAAVLSIVAVSGLSVAQSATLKSGADRDAATAIAAAYAGIADYSARLTNDNTYVDAGDPQAPFSKGSTGLTLPAAANPAFCYGQTSAVCTPDTWATVPGGTGNEAFRYEVDNAQFQWTGTVQLLATGRSGSVTRSVRAIVRQDGFLNYVYFSNYETMDPALLPSTTAVPNPTTTCTAYEYAPQSRNTGECGGLISFLAGENINGPIRSNDAMNICGGTFTNEIETADPSKPNYLSSNCGNSKPVFKDKAPQTVPVLGLPSDNTSMVAETASTDPNPGCMYTGPTAITFNSNGTMTVVSPWTKSTYSDVAQSSTDTVRAAMCGTPGASGLGAARSASDPTGGQTLPVPTENLIYVQSVPTANTSDPNYWGSAHPTLGTASVNSCTAGSTGVNDLGYPWTSTNNSSASYTGGTTYPTVSAPKNGQGSETVNQFNGVYYYNCTDGDAFITGTVHGQVTVAAQHYVYATGSLTYQSSATDLLGIDGQQAIWVWNPAYGCKGLTGSAGSTKNPLNTTNDTMTSAGGSLQQPNASGCAPDLTQNGRTIDAAMMSVADTFQVQNYNIVGNGTQALTVTGAIVQNFRGTVGTSSSTGFLKEYNYDSRLASISPPRFQTAVAAPWSPIQYSAATPEFSANGAVE